MTIKDIIADTDLFNDDHVIYAKTIDGVFTGDSEVILLQLNEEEMDMPIAETIQLKCPGFSYFLEASILSDLLYDLENETPAPDVDQMVASIIHYVEFDA